MSRGFGMGWVERRTQDVPTAQRFDWWCELVGLDFAPTHVSSDHRDDFRASAASLALGQVNLSVLSFPTLRSARTPQLIRRSDPELWELAYVADGVMSIDQDRGHAQVRAGDLLLYDTSRPFESRVTEGGRIAILHLPKSVVPMPPRSLRALLARRLPARGSGALLAGLLQGLAGRELSDPEADRVGSAAVELASAFLGSLADRQGLLPQQTRQAALLREIKTFISANLGDPELNVPAVAQAHCMSVRTLHNLFREEGRTVGAFIREERLGRCRADLTAGASPVAAVGARCGFTDATVFSRAFKAAYGIPPGEYRLLHAPAVIARTVPS